MYTIKNWLLRFLDEKGIDLDTPIIATSLHTGTENHMTLQNVVDFLLAKSAENQKGVQMKLITIDFRNGDPMDFFKYVARFMAVDLPPAKQEEVEHKERILSGVYAMACI